MFLKDLTLYIFALFFFSGASVAQASINSNLEVVRNSPALSQEMLYRVSGHDLESIKNSLMQINLHMREGAGKPRPRIKVVIHGLAAKFFYTKNMDSELRYMFDWFLAERVKFGICKVCKETFDIDLTALPVGFVQVEN